MNFHFSFHFQAEGFADFCSVSQTEDQETQSVKRKKRLSNLTEVKINHFFRKSDFSWLYSSSLAAHCTKVML